MCEANVFLVKKDGTEEMILDSVDRIVPEGEGITLENIFSQRVTVRAKIKEMALVAHRVVLEEV